MAIQEFIMFVKWGVINSAIGLMYLLGIKSGPVAEILKLLNEV